ncbi:metallophosphoesterase family protein [Corynebacterium breve]|uniref:Metallophosphoesterase family protein n=1 Tax=Corynebacterium breve TaxID=3049799 RepID=A0ABY8VFX5_9CORY|nr:metallophosphoesterase family protein [Corynebacterium breve]WIM67173.1 metallophosphoesterase family protein [Corynebacterium breve]
MKTNLFRARTALAAAVTAAVVSTSFVVPTQAFAQADDAPLPGHVLVGVGTDETEVILSWTSVSDDVANQQVQVAPASAGLSRNTESIDARSAGSADKGLFGYAATVSDLKPSTEYVYRIGDGEHWGEEHRFTTGSGADDWKMLFFGDPQIGADDIERDGKAWHTVTDQALKNNADAELLVTGGDHVDNKNHNRDGYDQLFHANALNSVPTAANRGNDDTRVEPFGSYFVRPNVDPEGNYFFHHNNALIVSLDTSATNTPSIEADRQFVHDVVTREGASADWVIVTFHHSLYSEGAHKNDPEINRLRDALAPTFSEVGVDLVLSGHDHSYSRSHLIDGTTPNIPNELAAPGDAFHQGDSEVLYITANSSTGSQFYDLHDNDGKAHPEATVDQMRAEGWTRHTTAFAQQDYSPDYSQITITADTLKVSTRNAADDSIIDEVTLSKNPVPVPEGTLSPEEAQKNIASSRASMAFATVIAMISGVALLLAAPILQAANGFRLDIRDVGEISVNKDSGSSFKKH